MKPTTDYTIYFKNEWLPSSEMNHEFVEDAMNFGNGVSGELRSYCFNGGPHIFKARRFVEEIALQAEKKGIVCDRPVEDIINLSYELLEKNKLTNARILLVMYKGKNSVNLILSASQAESFSIRENVQIPTSSFDEVNGFAGSGRIVQNADKPFFFVKDGILYTPKVEEQGYTGVIRDTIIKCALLLAYPVVEKTIHLEEIEGSEAVFFSSPSHEINFVTQLGEATFSKDWRETMAMDLLMLFRQQATNEDSWNYLII